MIEQELDPKRDEGRDQVIEVVRGYLADNELESDEVADGVFSFALPGEKKLQTPVRLDVGPHALGIHAFVCRRPDENHERVWRWLLERNLKMYAVAFACDHHGDIYLDARLPLDVATPDELELRRRVVQRDPRARLRLLDPQGVGVAQAARGVHPQPRGVPGLAGGRGRRRRGWRCWRGWRGRRGRRRGRGLSPRGHSGPVDGILRTSSHPRLELGVRTCAD